MSPVSEAFVKRLAVLASLIALGAAVAFLVVACAQESSAPSAQPPAGRGAGWHVLPRAPITVNGSLTSVWTGKELIVSGVRFGPDGNLINSTDVTAAYDPSARAWRRLPSPPETPSYCRRGAVWSGSEMLVWGCGSTAFDPETNHWRRLPRAPSGEGIVVWTGREMIGWGGGCCGDAWSDGAAYDPSADTWRKLAKSPLAPSQGALGAWTGRELVLFVSGTNPAEGKPWPPRFARAAAYDPAADTWRRIAPLPIGGLRFGGTAVWDGHEVLVVGAGAKGLAALAYDPAANRWRRLAPLPSGSTDASAVWTGERLLVWGSPFDASGTQEADGLAYDPTTDRWSPLPPAPLRGSGQAVQWTGMQLILWGGVIGTPPGTNAAPRYPTDGAAFTPALERNGQ
jgi:hypothetical protein